MDPTECLAIVDGETRVRGLDGPITVVRDRWGVPHVRAGSLHDAFFAQGFCMAQDRTWQIELIRHRANGRAAELLGKGLLKLDMQSRRLGFPRYAAREWEAQSPESRAILEAYAAGINEAIRTQPVPFELLVLGREMAPWSPVDSLAIIKMVNSGQQWSSKLRYAQVAAALGPEVAGSLIPDVPPGTSVIVPSGASWTGLPHPFREDISLAMGEPDGPVAAGGGSNCWVIHGSRTESGAPLVAGDPHLPVTLPGQWYVMHIECPDFTVAGPCNPGYPGPVFYGHNTKVAWTMTHAQGDRWDLYRERIRRGANGPEALWQGEWHALTCEAERYDVKDGEPVTARVWFTRHGPVLHGDPEVDDEVVAARWGLAEPAHDMDAMVAMLRASNAAEAREALRTYDSVSGNYCFADMAGDIGYQYVGRIPRREAWMTPVPGWTGTHEWDGDVPKDELPCEANPDAGYLLTANNRTTGPEYPHYLTYVTTRFRADRLRELIDGHEGPFTADDMRAMQSDQTSIQARELGAAIAAVPARTPTGERVRELLAAWDGHLGPGSAAALALHFVCDALAASTVRPFLRKVSTTPDAQAYEERRVLHEQLMERSALMLDGESWEVAIGKALDEAGLVLEEQFGADLSAWRWDAIHQVQWRHNLGREGELAALLNPAAVPVGGDGTSPLNTVSDERGDVPQTVSYRQVFDMADLNAARIVIPPGNSGQPGSPHYADNLERWRNVEYHPLYIDWGDIEANTEARLTLVGE
jgi:penicillin amidase